ncbi:hypothetical protein HAX54_028674, partial [Datura stramonium]|nr:hypothetical protein [Datura stramonium]
MRQVHDNEDEVLYFLVSGVKLQFDLVPKVDIDKSSFVDGAPTNADLKKEINDFRLHVDVKFGEILEVLSHLTKKLE